MIKHTRKHGFYTIEAALVLPFVILAVFTIGFIIKVDALWENCMFGALDESSKAAAKASDTVSLFSGKSKVADRVIQDNPAVRDFEIEHYLFLYNDLYSDKVTSFSFKAQASMPMPAGFAQQLSFKGKIKYRGFTGHIARMTGIGAEALETDVPKDPVWIFPKNGTRYHTEKCSYVTATVKRRILNEALRREYPSCQMCGSENLSSGSLVFCFTSEGSAYHRGNCRSIKRHPAVVNRSEAEERGFTPCTKCGGKGD